MGDSFDTVANRVLDMAEANISQVDKSEED